MGAYMVVRYAVACDGENFSCKARLPEVMAISCRDAVDQAVQKGWVKEGRKVFCPSCAEKKAKGTSGK
jgi:hypothetical protein